MVILVSEKNGIYRSSLGKRFHLTGVGMAVGLSRQYIHGSRLEQAIHTCIHTSIVWLDIYI